MDGDGQGAGEGTARRHLSRFVEVVCEVKGSLHWEYREFYIPKGSSIERRLVRDMAKAK